MYFNWYYSNYYFQYNNVLLVATDNEAFSGNKLMMLNETGRFIWENLQNFSSLEELIDKAKKEFSDDNGLLRQEMLEFVTSLSIQFVVKQPLELLFKLKVPQLPLLLFVLKYSLTVGKAIFPVHLFEFSSFICSSKLLLFSVNAPILQSLATI